MKASDLAKATQLLTEIEEAKDLKELFDDPSIGKLRISIIDKRRNTSVEVDEEDVLHDARETMSVSLGRQIDELTHSLRMLGVYPEL